MKLNFFERLFITSPVRPMIQRHFEARQLMNMGGPVQGGRVLETGCGAGSAIDLIHDRFGAAIVHAFDLDPRMIARARRRLNARRRKNLWVGNLRSIPVPEAQYDAVFNFGAIHHVVRWRSALAEIHRVLKPGGRFYCEEILRKYITHPVLGKLMEHPQQDRFDEEMFVSSLTGTGFRVLAVKQMADLYLWVIAEKPVG